MCVRVGHLYLPKTRKRYKVCQHHSRVEEEQGAQSCPCDNADESRIHRVGECELYKEERNVPFEEMKKLVGVAWRIWFIR